MTRAAVVLASVLATSAAHAEDQPASKTVSVTMSPIHLIVPMAEVTGEFKLADDVGLAGIVGLGLGPYGGMFEVGGQGRYYILGNFDRGLNLGGELMYIAWSGTSSGTSFAAAGLSGGPFFGGKYAWDFGFTLDGQIGLAVAAVGASSGGSSASAAGVGLLLNLNLGWSF